MKKFLIVISALLSGCDPDAVFEPGDVVYQPHHASGFVVFEAGEHSRVIRITDPWQGAEGFEQWVFVARDGKPAPENFKGTVLPKPPERVICMSSSYTAFMTELGIADRIVGVSGAQFISDSLIGARHRAGDIADVGYDNNLDYERIATLRPDLMLVYGVRDEGVTGKLRDMGVPYVFVGEYLEESPLGKAEWIVALGQMFGIPEVAESRFEAIEQSYDELRTRADEFELHPKVMLNAPYRDVWYAPGDLNYMVRMIRDAGGEYVCAGVESRDSRPIDIEEAYVAMRNTDFWIHTNHYSTLDALLADNPRFARTPPVLSGRVFNNNARTTPGGGSDFWESAVVRPDIVLGDLMNILHPEAFSGEGSLYYYTRLQ